MSARWRTFLALTFHWSWQWPKTQRKPHSSAAPTAIHPLKSPMAARAARLTVVPRLWQLVPVTFGGDGNSRFVKNNLKVFMSFQDFMINLVQQPIGVGTGSISQEQDSKIQWTKKRSFQQNWEPKKHFFKIRFHWKIIRRKRHKKFCSTRFFSQKTLLISLNNIPISIR